MKQRLILLSAFVIFFGTSNAQLPSTLLWSIEGDGLQKSYILLTGLSCGKEVMLSEKVKKVLSTVKCITVEYDLYSKDAQKLASFNVASKEEEKVKNVLSNGEYNSFLNLLKDAGYPENILPTFAIYKPAVIYMVLKSIIAPCNKMSSTVYEQAFKKIATQYKCSFKTLQSVDGVINDLKAYSQDYWKENIKYILSNPDAAKSSLQKELSAYRSENLTDLHRLLNSEPYYKKFFLVELRKNWVTNLGSEVVKQASLESSLFTLDVSNVLVEGASLFQELKSKGYMINPVL